MRSDHDPFFYYAPRIISAVTLAIIAGGGALGALPLIEAAFLCLLVLIAFGAYLFCE
jgi:hypothetical protein